MDLKKLSTKEMHDSKDRERAIHWTCPFVRLPGIYLYKVGLFSVCMFECIFKKHSVKSVEMICFDKVPNISLIISLCLGSRLSEKDLTITRQTQSSVITTAVLRRVYSGWGLLRSKDQNIIFKNENLFHETAPLTAESNLTTLDLEIGDTLAVHVEENQEKIKELMSSIPDYEKNQDLKGLWKTDFINHGNIIIVKIANLPSTSSFDLN